MLLVSLVLIQNIMLGGNMVEPWMQIPLYVGIALWLVGFYFQAVGDAQLKRFKENPTNKGKLIQTGLWALTRHPNYAGEVFMWWGIAIMGIGNGFVQSMPWLPIMGVFSAFVVTALLRFISGVPLLERKMKNHPDFAEYAKKTSIFFPWFPKK
jgi:steroid 5-alpha reductase family enzyme